jgi:hypothetical protein
VDDNAATEHAHQWARNQEREPADPQIDAIYQALRAVPAPEAGDWAMIEPESEGELRPLALAAGGAVYIVARESSADGAATSTEYWPLTGRTTITTTLGARDPQEPGPGRRRRWRFASRTGNHSRWSAGSQVTMCRPTARSIRAATS